MQTSTPTAYIYMEEQSEKEAERQESKSRGRRRSWETVNYSIMGDKRKKGMKTSQRGSTNDNELILPN